MVEAHPVSAILDLSDRVHAHFGESAQLCVAAADAQSETICRAAERIVHCLIGGSRVLCCGNGSSAADGQYFALQMQHRFDRERPGLPALALTGDGMLLTALAASAGCDGLFAHQINALGQPGDLLLLFSSHGNTASVVAAVDMAHERQMSIIALTGSDGGEVARRLGETDLEIRAPAQAKARILENHRLVVHCLCDLIDLQLMGG